MRISLFFIALTLAFPALAREPAEPTVTVSQKTVDEIEVVMDVYAGADASSPVICLFHQGGSSARGEYADHIIPRLLDEGFAVIAADCRLGGEVYGGVNRTATALPQGADYDYCDAYPDLYAPLAIADALELTGPRFVWGSSYTGALALRLASEQPNLLAGVLAFSPASGEGMGDCAAYNYSGAVRIPAFLAWPASELERETAQRTRALAHRAGATTLVQPQGVHGSSMLHPERSEGGTEAMWQRVLAFIKESAR